MILLIMVLPGRSGAQRGDSLRLQRLYTESRADSVAGNYLNALKRWHAYRSLKDSLLFDYGKSQASSLERQFQTKKREMIIRLKERNIKLLNTENDMIDRSVFQTKQIRLIIMVAASFVVFILSGTIWQYRQKMLGNRVMERQHVAILEKNIFLEQAAKEKDQLLVVKELLIKEIHHRVKNNLQIVISLLNTQSAYLNDPETAAAIRQSQHRMQTIALIHHKLYQSESRAVISFADYVQELLHYLRQSFETSHYTRFKVSVADIEMDVLKAVPLGLIINEMLTNSLRHAFDVQSDGTITVELTGTISQGFCMLVGDNGKGLSIDFDINSCSSMGINLIKKMCEEMEGIPVFLRDKGFFLKLQIPSVK
ncbi:sensor histidine kinase [Mucilaginibacter terrenus]|nr:histidine kinase dimerization/phosphoacceptor domain -containing protein [Mucilaginibacter terrenus]